MGLFSGFGVQKRFREIQVYLGLSASMYFTGHMHISMYTNLKTFSNSGWKGEAPNRDDARARLLMNQRHSLAPDMVSINFAHGF